MYLINFLFFCNLCDFQHDVLLQLMLSLIATIIIILSRCIFILLLPAGETINNIFKI